jgi:hypothetical protein
MHFRWFIRVISYLTKLQGFNGLNGVGKLSLGYFSDLGSAKNLTFKATVLHVQLEGDCI